MEPGLPERALCSPSEGLSLKRQTILRARALRTEAEPSLPC